MVTRIEDWTISDRPYVFSLSHFRLARVVLRTAYFNKHFTTLPADPDESRIPFAELGADADVFVVRPHPITAELPMVTAFPRAVRYVPWQYRRTYTDLGTTFEDYAKKFSGKTRNTIKRMFRQFKEHVGDQNPVRRFEGAEGITQFHASARQIAEKTYQEKLAGGGLPAGDAYLAEMRRLASEGRARGYLLMHGEKPVSYLYLVAQHGVLYFESTGYDPAYSKFSPGRSLLFYALEEIFPERKYPLFDYGEQEGAHKDLFGTHHTQVAHCFYFMRRPKPLAVLGGQAGLQSLSRGVKATLEKYDLEQRARDILGRVRGEKPKATAAPADEA
jgi:hypothetical protein